MKNKIHPKSNAVYLYTYINKSECFSSVKKNFKKLGQAKAYALCRAFLARNCRFQLHLVYIILF